MSMITLVATCLWFFLLSNFTGANQANIDCLIALKSQVEDPNDYLSSWVFSQQTEGFICKFIGVTCWHDDENRVMSLELAGFGLSGKFPLGLNECTDMTSLDLSRNNFSGPLPSNIISLVPFLTTLDLSYNNFDDEFPASLSNMTFLNALMLQHNQFTGPLLPELFLLGRLKKLSVADNLLTGPIPNFNRSLNFGPECFADNLDLCGLPLEACQPEEEIRLGKIGAVVGAAIFAPVGAFLGWFFFKEKQERHRSWIFHIGD